MNDFLAYRGTGELDPGALTRELPDVPPWRDSLRARTGATTASTDGQAARGMKYQIDADEVERVNAALYLRRPLLVTGEPGTGKSTLAYAVAAELGLGEVLRWPITSKSTLRDGLYHYDAIGRLQEANLREIDARHHRGAAVGPPAPVDIGSYIRLGPLGTALLPARRPRVLLVDELDKSDIDLPNDLLDVFEEGEFTLQEIARLPAGQPPVTVMTADEGGRVELPAEPRGVVRCEAFPFVIITSNGERQFPPAFLRRCLQLTLQAPDAGKLARIVEAHLPVRAADYADLIEEFLGRKTEGELATDELLNAVFLRYSALRPQGESAEQLADIVMPYLDKSPG
ncbi:MAG TPA: MoxR family ATPase [Trebonia sp.]|nr:MoxR family ATPase [Trebonia sp.]